MLGHTETKMQMQGERNKLSYLSGLQSASSQFFQFEKLYLARFATNKPLSLTRPWHGLC